MSAAAGVVNALQAGREGDATALVFEYMAATLAEAGRCAPAGIGDLPPALQHECHNLQAVYRQPGALLVAYRDEQPVGCVGLAPCPGSAPPRSSGWVVLDRLDPRALTRALPGPRPRSRQRPGGPPSASVRGYRARRATQQGAISCRWSRDLDRQTGAGNHDSQGSEMEVGAMK